MGEARRRGDLISVLIPERGRPEALDRCISSLLDTAGGDDLIEILVAIDTDDPAWIGREPFMHSKTRYVRWDRPPTLGEKLNLLAREAKGGLILWLANDQVMVTPGWPVRCCEAAREFVNGCGVGYLRDPTHPGHTSYWMLTRKLANARWFAPPWYPYWFIDTHWDEVATICGLKIEIDAEIASPDGRGLTHGMVDLPFWMDFFERMRPERAGDAGAIATEAFGKDSERVRVLSEALSSTLRLCELRTEHMHSPEFLREWGGRAESEPGPKYAEVKEHARKVLAELEAKMPRRVRVAICCPSGETWRAQTATFIAAMAAYSAMIGIEVSVINAQMSSVSHVRNATVELAFQGDVDWLMWIDSDMKGPPDALVRLLKHNKDIVGATYCKKVKDANGDYRTLGLLKGPKPDVMHDGLHEALGLPHGMLLVRTGVYKAIKWPWYYETYAFHGGSGLEQFKSLLRRYFVEEPSATVLEGLDGSALGDWMNEHYMLGENNEFHPYVSEDMNFMRTARKHGFEVWMDMKLTYEMVHVGTNEVTCLKPEPEMEALREAAE